MGNLNDLINKLSESKNFNSIYEELDSSIAMTTRMTVAQKQKLDAICHVFGKKKSPMIADIVVSAMNDIVESMDEEQHREMCEYLGTDADGEIVNFILRS